MNPFKTNSAKQFFNYICFVLSMAKKQEEENYYRLVNIEDKDILDYQGGKIPFQITGTSRVLWSFPEDIMRDDLLMGFSRRDVTIITYLGTKREEKIRIINKGEVNIENFKIIKEIERNGKTCFLIEEGNFIREYEASELHNNPEILEKLNGTDGIKVGFVTAEDHFKRTKNLK